MTERAEVLVARIACWGLKIGRVARAGNETLEINIKIVAAYIKSKIRNSFSLPPGKACY